MKTPLETIHSIERFQLLFLAQLGTRLDKKLYALKGGCNLRFFLQSIGYSEDIDFDLQTIAPHTLRKNVSHILASDGFERILRAGELEIASFSEAKQTDTTQRWKVRLRSAGATVELPTKIEFSRRRFQEGVVFEPVDRVLVTAYRLAPIIASHYGAEAAFAQKLDALLGRRETQVRDVFDLSFLADRGASGALVSSAARQQRSRAAQALERLTFEDYQGQVVAYLAADYQSYYGARAVWEDLRDKVGNLIKKL